VTAYVPAIWHQVKVVLIPKPSRSSYTGPRDCRPISLISFPLKTMQRLVERILRDKDQALMLLHPNQHAYQARKSVETTLHQLVVWVENLLDQQETTLGVFLDIEGAFSNSSCGSMCAALVRYRVGCTIVQWIRATLEVHLAMVTLSGPCMRAVVPH